MQTDTLAAPCGALSKNQPASTSVFFPARLTDNRESKYFLWINKAEHLQPRRLDTTAFHNGSRENERWKLIAREQKSYYFSPPVRFQLLDSCLPKLHTHTHSYTHIHTYTHSITPAQTSTGQVSHRFPSWCTVKGGIHYRMRGDE